MNSILPVAVGIIVLAAAAVAIYLSFRDSKQPASSDDYSNALEHWIEGNLDEAQALLHKMVHDNPEAAEPFYQLGNLLRIRGDAERAAVLHRGLTVRSNLTPTQKMWVGLSLAKDLNALGQWEGARDVLDSLPKQVMVRPQYWKTRFAQWHGLGDLPEAGRTLKNAARQVQEKDRPWFLSAYASYQLDRALTHALASESGEANARLRDVKSIAGTTSRSALVRAILAAVQNDPATAVSIASDSLLDSPEELDVFLPLLQEVLLASGQFARSMPILERACQSENAPPSLWIDLAMLYEKLGQRENGLLLLESKAGSPNFTPDAAAPYLKMLAKDVPNSDFAKVWSMLSMPGPTMAGFAATAATAKNGSIGSAPPVGDFIPIVQAPPHRRLSEVTAQFPRSALVPGWMKFFILALLMSVPALASRDAVDNLFRNGKYQEARLNLEESTADFRAGEATLWSVRLATDPALALDMLREGLADERLPDSVRIRMGLETADIEFGRGHYQASLQALAPLLEHDEGDLPGDVYLRAALAIRALGDLQKAREMLASVKPPDQAFMLARFYLGDIALQQKDASLALRYFDSATGGPSGAHPRIAGGQWRALRAEGREQEADDLEKALGRNNQGSLAMLEIQRLRREQQEELAAMVLEDETSPTLDQEQPDRGRYALQLGAFSDRGLALEFLKRYRQELPDLRIDEVRDERGQFLYKVRTGSFVNPALARSEAQRLAHQFDMDVIVADLTGPANGND